MNVYLPSQFSLETIKEISSFQAFGLYKSYTVAAGTLKLDFASNSFMISACDTYVENDIAAAIEIDSLRQYNFEGPTDSVRIQITSKEGHEVA